VVRTHRQQLLIGEVGLTHAVTVAVGFGNTVLGNHGGGMAQYRVEHDSMGDVKVPVDARWGAQTQRAVDNFPISGTPVNERVIRALAMIKAEAARVNAGLPEVANVDRRIATAIAAAADEIAGGAQLDQFPIDAFQTGSGTSTNMNANEVIA